MNAEKLQKIIDSHKLWLLGKNGERAYLQGAYLKETNLEGAFLLAGR